MLVHGHTSSVGMHLLWAYIICDCISVVGGGSLSSVGTHHSWAHMVCRWGGHVICGHSSFMVVGHCRPGVGHCHLRDGRPWVVGRGVVVVPGCCRLGVICGRWVSFVGTGCCSCALGTLVCWLCVVGVGAPSCVIVVGCGVVVGCEVVVACFGGPGFQLG